LASGGADTKVIFWDLATTQVTHTIKEHKDKVQIVKWNKMEDNVLLTGSYDKTMKLFDVRSKDSAATIEISAEVESVDWSSMNKYLFLASYDNGKIDLYDMRKFESILNFDAHKKACTSVTFSNKQDGLFSSVGLDSHVKIWDSINTKTVDDMTYPTLICEKFVKKSHGELFVTKFSEDMDYTLAIGGSRGALFIWQLEENPLFCNRYGLKWEEEKVKII
jgi:periodic tryptophan protein 1